MITFPVVNGLVQGVIPRDAVSTAIVGDLCTVYMPGDAIPPPPPPSLASLKAAVVFRIDADVDAIYLAAVGNRGPEYMDAERDATAYVDAGYTGQVPAAVASWATAKGWTATQAADDILTAAASLNGAKQAIRAARLLRKEQARNAADQAALDGVEAQWAGFVAAIRGQLGL